MYQIKIEKFNGPLDLLLQLIEQQKMAITEIYLGQVTEQYLAHIEELDDNDPEELADFLVIAARLLLIKSNALLPYFEAEEEVDDLEKQLKLYKKFQEASQKIDKIIAEQNFIYSREKIPIKTKVEFSPPHNLCLNDFREAMLVVLKRLDPLVRLPRQAIEKTISLQQKIDHLKDLILTHSKINFKEYLSKAENKTEVIVSFMAILELLKQRQITVRQNNVFDEIHISKI